MQDVYRSAASVVLLKRAADGDIQVLLLHKPRKKDAWQLPQGGSEEGETLEQTALRELQEEAGITDVRVLGQSEKFYKYDFPASFRRFRPDNICGQKIGFVFALAPEDVVVNVDNKEIDQFVWVYPGQLKQYIKRKEYLSLAHELIQEALAAV